MIDKILEYQSADAALIKLEDEIQKSEERKRAKQAQDYLRSADENLQKMDKSAAELYATFRQISEAFKNESEQLQEYKDIAETAEDAEDLLYLNKKVNKSTETLASLDREMTAVLKKIEELNKTFKDIMEKAPKVKRIYVDARARLEALKKDKEGEIKSLTEKLSKLEKQNDPRLIEAYKRLRSGNTLPAVVSLEGKNRCGGCRMDIAMTAMGRIESEKFIICDSCGRIVYKA